MSKVTQSIIYFLRSLISEPDGTPSSARALMFAFSIFTMVVVASVIRHVLKMNDPVVLNIWLSNLPLLIAAFMALISLPYSINKGTGTLTDIAGMVANYKSGGSVITQNLSTQTQVAAPTIAPPAAPTAVGSKGEKG